MMAVPTTTATNNSNVRRCCPSKKRRAIMEPAPKNRAKPLLRALSLSMVLTNAHSQSTGHRADPAILLKSAAPGNQGNAETLFGIPSEHGGGGDQPACHVGWDPTCQDDPTFISPLSLPCSGHETFDCRMTDLIGFTEDEIYELVNACPCSCRIPCGTHTKPPTLEPTTSPTVSHRPSSVPSSSPSSLPSSQPSPSPSASPTSSPSDAPSGSPSMMPSLTPTNIPSSLPSIMPSSSPTRVPTEGPTPMISSSPSSRPSLQPSREPSREPSQEPTNSPTKHPSALPSRSPTSSPSTSPTFAPSSVPSSTPSLSQQPSAEPSVSHMPTISSKPSSAPSQTRSMQPSSEPTTSLRPSAAPSQVISEDEKWAALARNSIGNLSNNKEGEEDNVPFLTTLHIIIIASVGGGMVLLTALYCFVSRSLRRRRAHRGNEEDEGPKVLFMKSKSFADRFNNDNREEAYGDDEENFRKSASPRSYRGSGGDIESNYSVGGYPRQNNALSCNGGCNGPSRGRTADDGWAFPNIFCSAPPPPTPAGDNSVKFRVAM